MKCEKCKAEFTLKEQARAKGCCPSCGEKLPASAYRDDAKARRWYQFHSPMPLRVILAYVYPFILAACVEALGAEDQGGGSCLLDCGKKRCASVSAHGGQVHS